MITHFSKTCGGSDLSWQLSTFFCLFFLKASLRAPEKRNLNDTLYPLPCQHKLLSSKSVSYFSPKIYLWQNTKHKNCKFVKKSDLSFHIPQSACLRYVTYSSADESVGRDELVCVPSPLVIHNRHIPEMLIVDAKNKKFSFYPPFILLREAIIKKKKKL